MKRGWKILIGALVALAILLTVNTIVLDQETKAAEVTVSGGRILDLPGGAVQVVEQGPTVGKRRVAATAPPGRRSCSCTALAARSTGGTGWSPCWPSAIA